MCRNISYTFLYIYFLPARAGIMLPALSKVQEVEESEPILSNFHSHFKKTLLIYIGTCFRFRDEVKTRIVMQTSI